jgi:hypothetical protein
MAGEISNKGAIYINGSDEHKTIEFKRQFAPGHFRLFRMFIVEHLVSDSGTGILCRDNILLDLQCL